MRRFWMMMLASAVMTASGLPCVPASAQNTPFTKSSRVPAAAIVEDDATTVLVLGTVHLRSYQEDFNTATLENLLGQLADFGPDLIAIENSAPFVIRDMVNSKEAYEEVREEFARRNVRFGLRAQELLGLGWEEAYAQSQALLDSLDHSDEPSNLTDARTRLTLLFLASYDLYSGLLQLSYLPEEVRAQQSIIPEGLRDTLEDLLLIPNENVSIGLALAARLGRQKLYPIDDHRDKEEFLKIADQLDSALAQNDYVKSQPWKAFYDTLISVQSEAYAAGDLLPFYLWLNSPAAVRQDIDNQWQLFFRADLDPALARARVAYWEVRNLSIAANIRRAMGPHPGKRMLVVIGASHKPYLDAYLNEMMDVRVLQLGDL